MSITITGDPVIVSEQIKKNSVTSVNTESIFNSVKTILERDEFHFFNTKKKYQLTKDINSTNEQIKKLLTLKKNGINKGKELKAKYLQMKKSNTDSINSLMEKLTQ